MKTPKILQSALRQYQHNNCSGLVAGFDYFEIVKIVNLLIKTIKAQKRLLIAYRIGARPPEWVFKDLERARKSGLKI